ncbi:MAG: hypothetical protein JW940_08820 [Polyangiaceae bacterium]|nr:hypothetical protein [Polyangiaceae bacterium]
MNAYTATGCQSGHAESRGGSSSGDDATGGASSNDSNTASSYPIDPDALVGCRAPHEPGCQHCCESDRTQAVCCFRDSILSEVDWDMFGSEDGPCPDGCPLCTQCDVYSEKQLDSVTRSRWLECDCARIGVGLDPCFGGDSCECDCSIHEAATRACPITPAEP